MASLFLYQALAEPLVPLSGGVPATPTDQLAAVVGHRPEPTRPTRRQPWAMATSVGPVAPAAGHAEPTVAASLVYSRNAEFPRPRGRLPQPGGVTPPDISGDRPIYGWARRLPELPARKRPPVHPVTVWWGPLTGPLPGPSWLRQTELPVRGVRRLLDAVGCAPARQPLPRFFAAENVLPNLRRKRLAPEGFCIPARQPLPPFVSAENVRPAPMRRLPPQPATLFAPARQPLPPFSAATSEAPPRLPRRRPEFQAPAARVDLAIVPPPLVWFVQHFPPVMLGRRHPEHPHFSADLARTNLLPDNRDGDGTAADDEAVAGG